MESENDEWTVVGAKKKTSAPPETKPTRNEGKGRGKSQRHRSRDGQQRRKSKPGTENGTKKAAPTIETQAVKAEPKVHPSFTNTQAWLPKASAQSSEENPVVIEASSQEIPTETTQEELKQEEETKEDQVPQTEVTVPQEPEPNKQQHQEPQTPKIPLSEALNKFHRECLQSPSFGSGTVEIDSRGLINPQNKCFLNVILQTLIHTKPFYDLLSSLKSADLPSTSNALQLFVKFFSEFSLAADKRRTISAEAPFRPDYFYPLLNTFNPRHKNVHIYQEDAQEFFSFLLDQMHEELLAVLGKGNISFSDLDDAAEKEETSEDQDWVEVGRGKKTSIIITKEDAFRDSPITAIFGGKLRSSLKKYQAKASASIQPFFCIPLDIKHPSVVTLEDALSWFGSPEALEGFTDTATKAQVRASKHTQFDKLSPILVFHLKRFSFVEGPQKIHKFIDFPESLTLHSSLTTLHIPSNQRLYQLFAVVSHWGGTATNGHYTCNIRKKNTWLHFDDRSVVPVRLETVLKDSNAYLLFYQRLAQ